MDTKRKRYPTKEAWARARAEEFRATAASLRYQSSRGSYARASRKGEQLGNLAMEAARFDRMAARFKARGQ